MVFGRKKKETAPAPAATSTGWFRGRDASDPSGPAAAGSGRKREGLVSQQEPDTEAHRSRVRGPDYSDPRSGTIRNFGRRRGE